jgi:hypothetical protein
MNKRLIGYAAFIFAALGTANAQADSIGLTAITVNGDKMVNDSVLNVTWADVVPASLVTFYAGPNLNYWGVTYAGSAQEWIASLNSSNYGGHNDWRLATGNGTSNCVPGTANELGCLFLNELGPNSNQAASLTPFTNLSSNHSYWSDSTCNPSGCAWGYGAWGWGRDSHSFYSFEFQLSSPIIDAIAVRTGCTSSCAPPVPIPATAWLVLSSICGLGVFARKRKA